MSNEELVSRIQQGERDLLPELWAQVERFVSQQARRQVWKLGGIGGVEVDDLYNAGYLTLAAAVETYEPARGMAFISWLALHLKTGFSEAGGYRSTKQHLDPLHRAASLDAPIGEDGTLEDVVADTVDPYEEAEDRLWWQQLRAELDRALDTLPKDQRDTIRRRFFRGQTLEAISAEDGVSQRQVQQWEHQGLRALRHPRISRGLRAFIEEKG